MSNEELIEKLRLMAFESLDNDEATMLHEAADALEAKAAPVGEREAFEAHVRIGGYSNPDKHPDGSYVSSVMELWWQGWKAGAAYQRQVHAEHEGPDYGDGPEFEGWAERSAQQPQSAEAVAYIPVDRATGEQWHPVKVKGSGAVCDYIPLYTTPQPSAGVVMPKRQEHETYYDADEYRKDGWNAYLDELARLNGKEVGCE